MISEQFRRQLRQEAKAWKTEGTISEEVYRQLSDRYQFESLEQAASNRFITFLLGLGGLLLGLGIITFVAANWQGWPRSLKIIVLLFSLVASNSVGFWLWQFPGDRWQTRFGQGLLLLGSLIFGANLALMSQLFHLDGSLYQLYLIWGLGVIGLGISLRITLLGVVALLLMAIAYGLSLEDWFKPTGLSGIAIILKHAPLMTGILGIFCARWWNSRVVFGLMMVMFIPSVWIQIIALGGWTVPVAIKFTLALTLPAAFLWSYDDRIMAISQIQIDRHPFQSLARGLALLLIALQLYILSFHGWWNDWGNWDTVDENPGELILGIDILVLMGMVSWQWFQLAKPRSRSPQRWGFNTNSILIFSVLSLTAIIVLWHFLLYPLPILAPLLLNIQIFLLAIGLIRWGVGRGKRLGFWSGLLVLTLQIISRMIEYDTGLLLKSIVFILCGIVVMAAGLWFEKKVAIITDNQ